MISDIKSTSDEREYGELASKLSRIATTAGEMGPEIRISNGFVLSFNELDRLLEHVKERIDKILSSEATEDEKHTQLRELLANHSMPESMKTDICNKYKAMVTDIIDKIPENARHIVSGIRDVAS